MADHPATLRLDPSDAARRAGTTSIARRLERAIGMALEASTAALVVAEIVILFGGVLARYVFHRPLVWSDEVASILFLWLAARGSALRVPARRESAHHDHVWDGHWITFNKAAWERLPDDLKSVVARAFNEGAVAQRAEVAQLNNTLQGELEKKGLAFNTAETQSFRELLNKNGFYKEWREKLGGDAWALLEKHVGKLG
jgi:hypothetical protein